ncbi:CPBP family intramembrane metalloprotease [Halomicrobium sp. IBSBa]|uniref:CPBP family intramembrane glutamic endopeptidase n=1 Tax=Halomicrobium sp. IBSBa TaxID=2778916 RepID=UPI001ABEFA42|nr:type II CAAX endopeptidase family protein [Halomicrobium sp. IBSBa]MBO4248092.1 CPBP family intramembrane metalloprotease [Halomicrobium sp. IBSBa]
MVPDRSPTEDILLRTNLWRWLSVVFAPFVLTVIVLTAVFTVTGGESPIPRLSTGVYSLLSALVVVLLLLRLSPTVRAEVFPTQIPKRTEVGAVIAATLVTVLLFDPIGTFIADVFGSGGGTADAFDSSLGAAIFVVSSVAIAPIVEEYLFRGVALDALRSRYGVATAIVGSSVLFGGIHFLTGGVSVLVSATLSGFLYAGMRVKFENLTGAIVAHHLNNLYWVLTMAGVLPNVVPT